MIERRALRNEGNEPVTHSRVQAPVVATEAENFQPLAVTGDGFETFRFCAFVAPDSPPDP